MDEVSAALEGAEAVYVAFDVDVLDPDDEVRCFMPEPGGFTVLEAAALLRSIGAEQPVAGIGLTGLEPAVENVAPLARLAAAAGI